MSVNETAGDSAAMREALGYAMDILASWRRDAPLRAWAEYDEAISRARAALAKPPRNCERFETAEDAKKEFNYLWNFVWKRGGGCVDEREYRSEYEKWLFATIQEGETNGSR